MTEEERKLISEFMTTTGKGMAATARYLQILAQSIKLSLWLSVLAFTMALAALIIPPAHAGEVYLQGGAAYQFKHGVCRLVDGSVAQYCRYDRTEYQPFIGHIELGYSVTQGRFTGSFYVRHESLLTTKLDYGVNEAGVALRARLWGRP